MNCARFKAITPKTETILPLHYRDDGLVQYARWTALLPLLGSSARRTLC